MGALTAPQLQPEKHWLAVAQVVDLGLSRSTLYDKMQSGDVTWRDGPAGREVLLETLSNRIQKRWHRRQDPLIVENPELPASVPRDLAFAEAGRRWGLLQQWEGLTQRERKGEAGEQVRTAWMQAPPALIEQCPSIGKIPHPGSLDRVLRKAQQQFEAGKNGALATLGRLGPRVQQRDDTLPDEAKLHIQHLWLIERSKTIANVARTYETNAPKKDWPVVCYDTIRRFINATPADVAAYARKGPREFRGSAAPFIRRSFDDLYPQEILCGDGHTFDNIVRCSRTGRLFRPVLVTWQDLRSRAIPGYQIVEQPNSRVIAAAMVMAIRPKRREELKAVCGLPRGVYIDNGKDYRARTLEGGFVTFKIGLEEHDVALLRGAFPTLHIDVTHARPYNAKAKPVERWFKTLIDQFESVQAGYHGVANVSRVKEFYERDVRAHKEFLRGERQSSPFLTLEEFSERFERHLFWWHQQPCEALSSGGRKLSPLDVYRLFGRAPELPRDRTLEFLLMERRQHTVQKGGVELVRGVWFWSEELLGHRGKRVDVRRDPEFAGRIYVFELTGAFICEAIAADVLRSKATPEQFDAAIKRIRNHERDVRKAIRQLSEQAPDGVLSLAEAMIADIPPPDDQEYMPTGTVHRMTPELDRVPLRQLEAPAEPPSRVLLIPSADPPLASVPRLRMFESDFDDAAESGKGGS